MVKLSVIIPLYNNEKHLQACIDSLSLQGVSKEDFEIIIVDDGSTDKSLELARRIAKDWENMRVVHQENQGSGVARNVGLDVAQGEYIHFVDADDRVLPGAYRFLFDKTLSLSPDMVYFDFVDNQYDLNHICDGKIVYSGRIREYIKNHHVRPLVWLKFFRHEYLLKNNLRLPSIRTRHDVAYTWDMMRYDGTMVVTNAKLYSHIINPDGATYCRNVKHVKETVDNLVSVNEKLKEYSEDYKGFTRFRRVADFYYFVQFNRILCTPFSCMEIRNLFPRCAKIGLTHLSCYNFFKLVDFLYHHPLIYFLFQKLILKFYFSRYKVPLNDRGDLLRGRLDV